jgi:hypothetical protein
LNSEYMLMLRVLLEWMIKTYMLHIFDIVVFCCLNMKILFWPLKKQRCASAAISWTKEHMNKMCTHYTETCDSSYKYTHYTETCDSSYKYTHYTETCDSSYKYKHYTETWFL